VRTFQRWAERYEAEGDDGLIDRRMGRRSPRRAPEEELERMLGLFRDKYADFTVKHFHEQLQKRHGYVLGYTVTKLALHAAGLVRKPDEQSPRRCSNHASERSCFLLALRGGLAAITDLVASTDKSCRREIHIRSGSRQLRFNLPRRFPASTRTAWSSR
jgi:transposase